MKHIKKFNESNDSSWFNEYQDVENYIIDRIGDDFLEATPNRYNKASDATIALLKDNMFTKEEVIKLLIKFNQEIYEVEDIREWFNNWLQENKK